MGTTAFPSAADDFATTSPTNLGDDDAKGRTHSERHDDIEAAMEAVQARVLRLTLSPDSAPATPSAYDYEFDATTTSMPSGWSWVNQGTATYSEALGAGAVFHPAGDTTPRDVRGLVRALPSESTWTATAKISATYQGTTTYQLHGMSLREAGTSKAYHFFIRRGPGGEAKINILYFTNDNTLSSETTTRWAEDGGVHYLRITRNSATSYDFLYSADGLTWFTIEAAYNPSGFTTAPDQIGLLGWTENGNAMAVANHHFRVTT